MRFSNVSLLAIGVVALLAPRVTATVTMDRHSGLEFTSGAVDYIGLRILEHEDGIGTIWEAIPKNHDLETGPINPVIVLAPDVITPVGLVLDDFEGATTLDRHSGLQFTSGGVDYIGLWLMEHEDGIGTIWEAIPKNHDLDVGPINIYFVLAPDVVTPVSGQLDLHSYEALTMNQESSFHDPEFEAATTLDRHSGLQFTSGGVDYIGLEILEHEDGIGTIWVAIPKNHDLDVGPINFFIVLAPDIVTPVKASYGAFEDVATNYWQYLLLESASRKRGDLDADGCVSSADLMIMLEHFGQSGALADGDVDGDGMITISDFATLHQNLGTCMEGLEPLEEDEEGQEIARLVGSWPFLPDTDGDGVLDAFEELKGTDPHESLDNLRITRTEITNEGLTLEWKSVAGVSYVIERSGTGAADSWEVVDAEPIQAESASSAKTIPVQPAEGDTVLFRIKVER